MPRPPNSGAPTLRSETAGVEASFGTKRGVAKKGARVSFVQRRGMADEHVAELRESEEREERYRIVADYSPDWDFWLGTNGRYEYVSPACEGICGYSAQEFLADAGFMERVLHPEDRARWLAHWQGILAEGESGEWHQHHHAPEEFRIVRADGTVRWIEHQCRPVFDANGRYRGRRGVNRDVTARKTAQEKATHVTRLYAILSGTNQIIARCETAEQVLARVTRIVVSVGGFAAAAVTLKDTETGEPALAAQAGLRPSAVPGIPWAALEVENPVVRQTPATGVLGHAGGHEHPTDARSGEAARAAAGTVVGAHFPLGRSRRTIGALSVFSTEPSAFIDDVLELLGQLAFDLSYAIEFFAEKLRRRAAEESLRDTETRYRRIVETTHEGVWSLDPSLRLTHVNDAIAQMLGYRREEMLGRSVLDFMFPEDHEDQVQRMRGRAAGRSESYERRLRCRDGSEALVRIAATPVVDAGGAFEGAFAVLSNLTLLRKAADAIEHNLLLRGLFERSPVAMILLHGPEHKVQMINREFTRKLGFTLEAMQDPSSWWHQAYRDPDERDRVRREWHALLLDARQGDADAQALETRITCKDEVVRDFQIHAAAIGQDHLVVLVDITELRNSERRLLDIDGKLRQVATAFESATEALVITDARANIVSVNPAFEEITGYSQSEVMGQPLTLLSRNSLGEEAHAKMLACLRQQDRWRGEVWGRRKSGEDYPAWLTVAEVGDDGGRVSHRVVVFRDISILRHSEAEIAFLAHHDRLTQLPNWVLLMDRLRHALARAREGDQCLAVLFVDLDRFKQVNDSLGHAVGDDLLRSVARRMFQQLRLGDTLARIGSDEFVVLLEDQKGLTRVNDLAERLGRILEKPFVFREHEVFITASIGISVHPTDGDDEDDGASLLKYADIAMRQAKARGRNTYQFYRPEMGTTAALRLKIESALRGALQRGEFLLYYQPQVDLKTGVVAGVEALLRWKHPTLGFVSPAVFIPIAEDLGVIDEIGTWVTEQACRQLREWDDTGVVVPRVAVNVSVQQLDPVHLVTLVERMLAENGLAGSRLELEITESMLMREAEQAISALTEIRRLGVLVAVDDFGTGYSSLGYIQRLPLDRLKVDASFVRDIGRSKDGENIVRAIIGLGQSLNLEVIAEGIERADQLDFLQREGCEIGQGFLFSKAVPSRRIPDFCRSPNAHVRATED